MKTISFVIPVFQNEGTVTLLYERIVSEMKDQFPDFGYEILFVDDGSTDESLAKLRSLRESDQNVKIITFSRNFGQMAAILAGWKHAIGDAVINISADLQDPVEQCTTMIKEWLQGGEVVISYRHARNDAIVNRVTSRMFYGLIRFTLPQIPPGGFDFALVDRKAIDVINALKERNRFYQGDLLWVGFNLKFIPYERLKREIGKSQYTLARRFGNFISAFINISYLPIRLMSIIGILTSFSGFLYLLTIVYAYYIGKVPFEGWAPIMVLILIIGGLIMLMLGIIGEYIWRIFDNIKSKPHYIIKEKYD